jgi:glycolate oxidase iron-sulfur subunit
MQTHLAPEFVGTREGQAAEAILRKCVHCGFCTATCPTYQLLGDELDGPRGRIYLIKQVLEGAPVTEKTQQHLDRCLTCRNCETTCPSGVQYGSLVEIGRQIVDERVPRQGRDRAVRWLLKEGLTSPLFKPAMAVGKLVKPLLPTALKKKVPGTTPPRAGLWPRRQHARKMLMLAGCVQPAMMPNINSATARVLDACGIQTLVAEDAGCCGAIRAHLNDHEGGLADMRRNIDAWWSMLQSGQVEAIVMNASGCGVTVKEYAQHLAHDPDYAGRARLVSDKTCDLSELLPELMPRLKKLLGGTSGTDMASRHGTVAYHPPCTLQHGQQLRGAVETHLRELGLPIEVAACESHLCCGSAGTYSVLQPELSTQLRDRKLGHLGALKPRAILSANIGCIQHLQSGTDTPVQHWVELIDEMLSA